MLIDIIFIVAIVILLIVVCKKNHGYFADGAAVCFSICFCLFIFSSLWGAFTRGFSYTERVEVDPVVSIESLNLYALKDNANGVSTTNFVLGQATTSAYTTYTFLTDDEENDGLKKVETVSTYSDEILFDDSLTNPNKARLDITTTETTVKKVPRELTLCENLFTPGYFIRNLFIDEDGYTKTEKKYIFVVPKDSITYEYDIDLE